MNDEHSRSSSTDDHPLYEIVGLLNAEKASRVRERVEQFRERLNEGIER